jgi:hypothetical protein
MKKNIVKVRIELRREHVGYLRDLIDAGITLDPLLVSEDDMEIIDGRHRKAAYLELGITEVECEIKKFASDTDKIITALRCNVGGSLPPTPADISHTMQILLTAGESRKSIIEKISGTIGFPKRLVQKHLDEVQSNLHKARLKKAVTAVASQGMTVHEAAIEFGVKLETLQRNLTNKVDENGTNVQQLKSYFSQQFAKFTLINGHNLSKVIRDLKDGVLTPDEVIEIISHVVKLKMRFDRYHDEWNKRFAAHIGIQAEVAEISKVRARKPQVSQGKKALDRMGLAA